MAEASRAVVYLVRMPEQHDVLTTVYSVCHAVLNVGGVIVLADLWRALGGGDADAWQGRAVWERYRETIGNRLVVVPFTDKAAAREAINRGNPYRDLGAALVGNGACPLCSLERDR